MDLAGSITMTTTRHRFTTNSVSTSFLENPRKSLHYNWRTRNKLRAFARKKNKNIVELLIKNIVELLFAAGICWKGRFHIKRENIQFYQRRGSILQKLLSNWGGNQLCYPWRIRNIQRIRINLLFYSSQYNYRIEPVNKSSLQTAPNNCLAYDSTQHRMLLCK